MHRRSLFLLLIAVLAVEITSCGGGHSTPPPVTVTVFAGSQTVPAGKTAFFTATVANSTNQSVTWAVVGGAANGTINSVGIYTAPASIPNPPAVTVTATAQADPAATGQASITVTVGVTVFPGSAALQTLGTAQ
ncbi:MAG TPA: hypothetical protein VMV59_10005, partial [Candidatus Dormibacteraeota bacterium]|nr:hypothetical protein [Candidatus Dormibacteraeota bacterium]